MKATYQNIKKYNLVYFIIVLIILYAAVTLLAENIKKSENLQNFLLCGTYSLAILIAANTINLILIPKFLYKQKTILFVILTLIVIIILGLAMMPIVKQIANTHYLITVRNNNIASWVMSYFIPLLLFIVITSIIKINRDNANTNKQLQLIEKEQKEAELTFLKAQMNPHFLLNSLNTIYFQIDKTNQAARETVLQFSELLRYQLYDCNQNFIAIEKEIQYLSNYISLQKTRKGNGYTIEFNVANELSNFTIAPLLLITFVENAFKYVSSSHANNYVKINLERIDNEFVFTCENSTDAYDKKEAIDYGGIGIANTKKRLQILYPKKHSLIITDNNSIYNVVLKITL